MSINTKQLLNSYKFILDKPFQIIGDVKGMKIIVEKSNDMIKVYKKNLNTPLTAIDKVLMKGLESLFEFISSNDFNFLPNNVSLTFKYDMDKKHITLINIQDKYGVGKYKNIISNITYQTYASKLGVKLPKHIYHFDKLNKTQISDILELMYKDFGTASKDKPLKILLRTILELNKINDKNIELFTFKYDDKSIPLRFIQVGVDNPKKLKSPNDIYAILIVDFMIFINNKNIQFIPLEEEKLDNKYLELMDILFVEFIETYGTRYDGIIFDTPTFMKSDSFDTNIKYIKNADIKDIIKNSYTHEQMYKILLAAFRKKRRKCYGIFTELNIKTLNSVIDQINNKINVIKESSILTFEEIINSSFMVSEPLDNLSTQFISEGSSKDLEDELNSYIDDIGNDATTSNDNPKEDELDNSNVDSKNSNDDKDDDGVSDSSDAELADISKELDNIEKKYIIYQKDLVKMLGNSSPIKRVTVIPKTSKADFIIFQGDYWTIQYAKLFEQISTNDTIVIVDNIDSNDLLVESIKLSNPNIKQVIFKDCLKYGTLFNDLKYNINKLYIYTNRYNEFNMLYSNAYFNKNLNSYDLIDTSQVTELLKEDNFQEWKIYFDTNVHFLYESFKKKLIENNEEI